MMIAPTLAVVLALQGPFVAGPSVRVSHDSTLGINVFDVRYIADFTGNATVAIHDNPNGSFDPNDSASFIIAKVSSGAGVDHTIQFNVDGLLSPNSTYFFQVIHRDINGNLPDLMNSAPLPPVFTGDQVIGNITVTPGANSALISWDANVIGLGQVDYGVATLGNSVLDDFNVTDHSILLTGLAPGTTYQFRASNLHAIDGGTLASATGSFTTLGSPAPEPSTLIAWAGLALVGLGCSRRRAASRARSTR